MYERIAIEEEPEQIVVRLFFAESEREVPEDGVEGGDTDWDGDDGEGIDGEEMIDFRAGFAVGLDDGQNGEAEVGFAFAESFWMQPDLAVGDC